MISTSRFQISTATIVFDLDDTLYAEADYLESGVHAVCKQITRLYGDDPTSMVLAALAQDPRIDWLELVCSRLGLPSESKESLLWMYRLHPPAIRLSEDCSQAIGTIRDAAFAVAILTDGRSVTQRLKLDALGLLDLPLFISEDAGLSKPDQKRFLAVQDRIPSKHYVYVGDNLMKDFLGCNPLGWITVGLRAGPRAVHSKFPPDLPIAAFPQHWVSNWAELVDLLFSLQFAGLKTNVVTRNHA